MNFGKNEIKKMIYRKKGMATVVVAFFALFVFLCVALTDIMNVKVVVEDVQNYDELIRNPYKEYENIMRKTKINDLINSEQFIEMKYNPDLIMEKDPEIKTNPFEKSC